MSSPKQRKKVIAVKLSVVEKAEAVQEKVVESVKKTVAKLAEVAAEELEELVEEVKEVVADKEVSTPVKNKTSSSKTTKE